MNKYNIAIVGGGTAGLAAAVAAIKANPALRVAVFEKNDRIGKKLISTGNGRCNFSNRQMGTEHFHSQNLNFISQVLTSFGTAEALQFFKSLGLFATEEDGRIYPYSQRAASVLDVLRLALEDVDILTNHTINSIKDLPADKIIITTGGLAAPSTGSTGDGLRFLSDIGHTVEPPYPALSPLIAKHPALPSLKGIRVKPCRLTLRTGRKLGANVVSGFRAAETTEGDASAVGEVLFTEYGLSGIPAMQVSGAMKDNKQAVAYLDLLPYWTEADVTHFFNERNSKHFPAKDFFTGLFHTRIGQALLKEPGQLPMLVKQWPFTVTGVKGYAHAQVTGGGCRLSEFDPADMQSRKRRDVYAAGEVLDAYGDCGGYNLHWAWATGYLAGRGAALSCNHENLK